jgi:hypothetical protein
VKGPQYAFDFKPANGMQADVVLLDDPLSAVCIGGFPVTLKVTGARHGNSDSGIVGLGMASIYLPATALLFQSNSSYALCFSPCLLTCDR